jgi:hypothetical protein
MKEQNSFVFVVCGAEEHINTLNFSLRVLRSQTNFPILVVTDLQRNADDINHEEDSILDIRTPQEYNNHQASIYLKTNLHQFLQLENSLYCYLDTDVVALNPDVSKVFNNYTSPITFATDHCRMNGFSPQAVNCGCTQMPDELQELIDRYTLEFQHLMNNRKVIDQALKEWQIFKMQYPLEQAKNEWFDGILKNRPELRTKRALLLKLTSPQLPRHHLLYNYMFHVFPNYRRQFGIKKWKDLQGNVVLDESPDYYRFMNQLGFLHDRKTDLWTDFTGQTAAELPKTYDEFIADRNLCYNSTEEAWYTTEGKLLLPNIIKLIERNSSYWYVAAKDTWYDEHDNRVFVNECNHLQDAIKQDFDVDVKQADWQHWNGGVFLFNKDSVPFLNTWHKLTLEAFSLPNWKTRDQGTLITTVWKFGLQNQPTLAPQFNFIADYYHPTMTYEGNLAFRLKVDSPTISPSLIHIYHHWNDKNWNVWNDVENHVLSK